MIINFYYILKISRNEFLKSINWDDVLSWKRSCVCFAAKVAPVTSGVRYSLVAWITGPQFK